LNTEVTFIIDHISAPVHHWTIWGMCFVTPWQTADGLEGILDVEHKLCDNNWTEQLYDYVCLCLTLTLIYTTFI